MSFWDMEPESENNLQSILQNAKEDDIEKVISNPELIQSFRCRDEDLISFLVKESNIESLLKLVFHGENPKNSKIGMELFAIGSPLLDIVLKSSKLLDLLVQELNGKKYLNIGYISRIFTNILQSSQNSHSDLLSYFQSSANSLILLFQNIGYLAIKDFLIEFISTQDLEDQWITGIAIRIGTSGKETRLYDDWYENESIIDSVYKQLRPSKKDAIASFGIVKRFTKKNLGDPDVTDFLGEVLPSFLNNDTDLQAVDLALMIPYNNAVAKWALEYLKQDEITPTFIYALQYLQQEPELLKENIEHLTRLFFCSNNSFYLAEYVKLIQQSEILQILAKDQLSTGILSATKKDNWRNQIEFIGFYMDIAAIIDKHMESEEWGEFRKNEIEKWNTKNELLKMYETPDIKLNLKLPEFAKTADAKETEDKKPVTEPKVEQKPIVQEIPNILPKPKEAPEISLVPFSKPNKVETNNISYDHFLDLINDKYWTYSGPPPEEIFSVKENFSSPEDAFEFLVNNN